LAGIDQGGKHAPQVKKRETALRGCLGQVNRLAINALLVKRGVGWDR